MDDLITRAEHEEFKRRMEDEDKRQNERLRLLEENTKQIGVLAASVERLALSIQGMVREQEQQGDRLEKLEGRDGEMWRKVVGYLITACIGLVLGYFFNLIIK